MGGGNLDFSVYLSPLLGRKETGKGSRHVERDGREERGREEREKGERERGERRGRKERGREEKGEERDCDNKQEREDSIS